MSVMKTISSRAEGVLKGGTTGIKSSTGSAQIVYTDIGKDMDALASDLTNRQMTSTIEKMSTVLRRRIVVNLQRGGDDSSIGRSQYGPKMTRGDWKNPVAGKNGMYLKGGWSASVTAKRGADKPTMAVNGGNTKRGGGNKGIITKTHRGRGGRKSYSVSGITGPRYGTDNKDDSKFGYNYAHMLEHGGTHKAWKRPARPLIARPFIAPAAKAAKSQMIAIAKDALRKWGKGQ